MCEVKVLVIGESERRSLEAINTIAARCREESNGTATLSCDRVSHLGEPCSIADDYYDIAAIDDSVVPTDCGRLLIGSDVPVVLFSDLSVAKDGMPIEHVVEHAVAKGNLRDKIAAVTGEIEETLRLLDGTRRVTRAA